MGFLGNTFLGTDFNGGMRQVFSEHSLQMTGSWCSFEAEALSSILTGKRSGARVAEKPASTTWQKSRRRLSDAKLLIG